MKRLLIKVDMEIKSLAPHEKVTWQCTNGPWAETGLFTFSISPGFSHEGWPETGDFYQHCNTKWGFFLSNVTILKILNTLY